MDHWKSFEKVEVTIVSGGGLFSLKGEALWTYLTTPFLIADDGVWLRVEEVEPWHEGAETWSVLRAYFPGSIETHSLVQNFYFGDDLMLRRHDYNVNIAGGFGGAQLTSNYIQANGIRLPSKRRTIWISAMVYK
jgi:hypothetical protein